MPERPQEDIAAESAPLSDSTKNGRLTETSIEERKTDVDSTDIDPCLNHKEAKPKKLPFYEQHIRSLQKRTGLSRKWVFILLALALTVFVLFWIIVGLSIGWPTIPHMFRFPICRKPQCLQAAAQVQENLNDSISPCTDLWGAVCAKYAKNTWRPLDRPVWDSKQILVQKESEKIRDLISTLELPVRTGTVEWKLKYLYEACLDVDSIDIDEARPLMNIISELGGWYILRNWNREDFDGMQLLTKLQVRYGVSPFFRIHVEPDPHVPDSHSIRISPSGLGLPDKDYYFSDNDDPIRVAYKDYIRDIVISLSNTKSDATKFGTDIFNYEQRIAEVTPDLASLRNPITTYNAISLEELKQMANVIPFYDILQAMYPEVAVSENTEVIVTSLEYLGEVARIISTTDRQVMNGYLIWSLVREYVPYLSKLYTSAKDSFYNELFGVAKPQKRWEICSKLLKKYMGLATEYHLEKLYPVSVETRQILNQTFKNILKTVRGKLTKFDDSVLLVEHLEAKLNTLSLQISLPESVKSSQFLKDYYHSLIILKLNLFEGVKNAIAFQKKVEQSMLQNALPEGVFLKEILREIPEVRYVPSKNAIVIPRSLVDDPVFENSYFRPVIYGRLGVEIAFAILSAVLPYGSLWTADRKILSPFHMTVNDSVKSVQPAVDCSARYISTLNLEVPASKLDETALNVLTKLSAIKVAYEALQAVSSVDNHRHYGGLEKYEESALYFISFAQTKCSHSTRRYDIYENMIRFTISAKSILDTAWAQLTDFQKALGCVPNKSTLCDIML